MGAGRPFAPATPRLLVESFYLIVTVIFPDTSGGLNG